MPEILLLSLSDERVGHAMKKVRINMECFTALGGLKLQKDKEGWLTVWPKEGGKLILQGKPGYLGNVDWSGATHLVADITGLEDFNPALSAVFLGGMEENSPSAVFNVGIIPGIRTSVSFPLDYLDSHSMFLPRTPGRLKEIVLGRGVELEQVICLILTTRRCHREQRIRIHDIYLTWEEPEYTIDHIPVVDRLGQWKEKKWRGKTASEEEMVERLRKEAAENAAEKAYEEKWSRYGGDLTVRFEPTGYFRTQHDGKRWYLVDPYGYRFLSTGLDCCRSCEGGLVTGIEELYEELPDKNAFQAAYEGAETDEKAGDCYVNFIRANLMRAFGGEWEEKWNVMIKNRLVDWHFNTIGNWSDEKFIRRAKLPYVWPLKDFPATEKCIFRDFPDVFSQEYEENAEIFARQLEPFKEDPFLIGYFLRNEPQWAFVQNLLIAEKVLENHEPSRCRERMILWLMEKYGTVENLNRAWNRSYTSFEDLNRPQFFMASFSPAARKDAEEFSRILISRYAEIPSLACRRVDPHHLNLGMRYSMLTDPVLLSGSEYFDVFSLNGYQTNPYEEVQRAGEITGKPVLIGEFHFGAPDAGLPSCGICSVASQKDRGLAYCSYYEEGLKSPYFVGAHYFILYDQPVLGRFDGENMQIGLLDVCSRPYEDCIEGIRRTNRSIYRMAQGEQPGMEESVNRIPRLMGF